MQHGEKARVGLRVLQLLVDHLKHLGGTFCVDVDLGSLDHSEGQNQTAEEETISALPVPSISGEELPFPDCHPGAERRKAEVAAVFT